jgi:hypothetical protein
MRSDDRSVRGWKHVKPVTDPDQISEQLTWNLSFAGVVVLSALARMTDRVQAEQLMATITPDHFFPPFEAFIYENIAHMLMEQEQVDLQALRRVTEEYTKKIYGAPSSEDVNLGYHLRLDQILIIDPTPQQLRDAVSLLQRFYAKREEARKAAAGKNDET